MKPVLLRATIPLVLSVAGYVTARLMIREVPVLKASSSANSVHLDSLEDFGDGEGLKSVDSASLPCLEDEHLSEYGYNTSSVETLKIQDVNQLEEGIAGLKSRMDELQEREWKLEMRFLRYNCLKDKEVVLMELQNMLLLEIERVEYLGREISSMESENQRFEDMAMEYLKALEQLEFSRMENGLLQRRVRKLFRKLKWRSCLIREQSLQIEVREAEISKNHGELGRMGDTIRELEDENTELKAEIERLGKDKHDLLKRMEFAEALASSKIEEEKMPMEDYNSIEQEVEQFQRDRETEVKELIYLRWCNACLRHELMRRNQVQNQGKNHLELELTGAGDVQSDQEQDGFNLGDSEPCLGFTDGSHSQSKRRKLIDKFRRWMEGTSKTKQKHDQKATGEFKCFGGHSVSDNVDEKQLLGRKSCSSP